MSLFPEFAPEFPAEPAGHTPLAERMRPRNLDEVVGQAALLAPGAFLRRALEADRVPSLIFWGPPGSGKTTLARLISRLTKSHFAGYSAVSTGIKEIKGVLEDAAHARRSRGLRTVLFLDEIHRFNKAQQDALLPYVESGDVALIGATTENPSFEVNGALLSRCRVLRLEPLSAAEVRELLQRALGDCERGLGAGGVSASEAALLAIAELSSGDARQALNILEAVAGQVPQREVTPADVHAVVQRRALLYDKGGEEHFNVISALHKSMRNSDVDAALYWLARMIEAGEDPLYVVRRVVRFASEDIGLADPQALAVAMAAKEAVHFVGMPEGNLALAQAVAYCALAPKSNALYRAYGAVREDVAKTFAEPVPLRLRNAVTPLMKESGYGSGYQYAHDLAQGVAEMQCLPDNLRRRRYYIPGREGFEREVAERMAVWERARRSRETPEESAGRESEGGDEKA